MPGEHEDQFDGLPADGWTREYEATRLKRLDELRDIFHQQARVFAQGVAEIKYISRWEHSTRRNTMSSPEAIEGFLESISDLVTDTLDNGAIDASKEIVQEK
jgi:hypothetical protein